jgi:hypothetical protein
MVLFSPPLCLKTGGGNIAKLFLRFARRKFSAREILW